VVKDSNEVVGEKLGKITKPFRHLFVVRPAECEVLEETLVSILILRR
jgi:hypothetical protein